MQRVGQVFWVVSLMLLPLSYNHLSSQSDKAESHTDWVLNSLEQMQTIQVGMSRKDLLKVFKEEGGLSTRTWRRYVYRECPFIKVDVEFEPVEAAEDKITQYPSDRIIKISKPFLERPITD